MLTLGDVLATGFLVAASALAAWSALVGFALLFPTRVGVVGRSIERRPWPSLGAGVAFVLPSLLAVVLLGSVPSPVTRVLALVLTLAWFLLALFGTAGLASVLAERLTAQNPGVGRFTALGVGSFLIVAACLLPVVGWFLVAPVFALLGTGAGMKAVFRRNPVAAVRPAEAE